MDTCSTVKSSDDEINKEFSFVSNFPPAQTDLTFLSNLVCILQKLEINGVTFFFYAESYEEKEGWIGALGRAMIKTSIMIDDAFDNEYM